MISDLHIAERSHEFSRGLQATEDRMVKTRRVATLECQPSLRDGIFWAGYRGLKGHG